MGSALSSPWRDAAPLPLVSGVFARALLRHSTGARRPKRVRTFRGLATAVKQGVHRTIGSPRFAAARGIGHLAIRPLPWSGWMFSSLRARRWRLGRHSSITTLPAAGLVSLRQRPEKRLMVSAGRSLTAAPPKPRPHPSGPTLTGRRGGMEPNSVVHPLPFAIRSAGSPSSQRPPTAMHHPFASRPQGQPALTGNRSIESPGFVHIHPTDRFRAKGAGPLVRPAVSHRGAEESPAARFDASLAVDPVRSTRPITGRLARLARSITGTVSGVRLATGVASRRALRAAGKRAATDGRTIHLAQAPGSSPAQLGTVAHELAHVAARKRTVQTTPRFFGDATTDSEELTARSVGESVRQSLSGSAPTTALARSGGAAHSPAVARRAVSSPQAEVVAAAANQAVVTVRAELESMVAEALTDQAAASPSQGSDAEEPPEELQSVSPTPPGVPVPYPVGMGSESAAQDDQSRLDVLFEAFEERILAELERRGGRYAEVF